MLEIGIHDCKRMRIYRDSCHFFSACSTLPNLIAEALVLPSYSSRLSAGVFFRTAVTETEIIDVIRSPGGLSHKRCNFEVSFSLLFEGMDILRLGATSETPSSNLCLDFMSWQKSGGSCGYYGSFRLI
jgi:hypothetical protein